MAAMTSLSVRCLELLSLCAIAHAYPTNLECSRSIDVGQTIMAQPVQSSSASVGFVGKSCGGTYTAGETLIVLSPPGPQYVLEVTGGTFSQGSCGGTRATSALSITAPQSGSMSLRAAHSSGYTTVYTTAWCTLTLETIPSEPSPSPPPSSPPVTECDVAVIGQGLAGAAAAASVALLRPSARVCSIGPGPESSTSSLSGRGWLLMPDVAEARISPLLDLLRDLAASNDLSFDRVRAEYFVRSAAEAEGFLSAAANVSFVPVRRDSQWRALQPVPMLCV